MVSKPEIERLAVLETEIKSIKETLNNMDSKLDSHMGKMREEYVHRAEFETVKRLVYGAASLILLTVFGAAIRLVLV